MFLPKQKMPPKDQDQLLNSRSSRRNILKKLLGKHGAVYEKNQGKNKVQEFIAQKIWFQHKVMGQKDCNSSKKNGDVPGIFEEVSWKHGF